MLSLLHLFMLYVAFPHLAGFMNLYLPSRSGGYDLPVSADKFAVINGVILAVAVVVAVLVRGMVRRQKYVVATAITFLLLFPAIVYVTLYVGSAFNAVWGSLGATLGVVGTIVIGMVLELPLLMWMNQNLKKK
ncbi:MAG: hypothetical protein JWM07_255 [Candidatus Saccharibacteria bacterium]|nr:hypothetical protein [Candidatus Saccharibacteria bacterium]